MIILLKHIITGINSTLLKAGIMIIERIVRIILVPNEIFLRVDILFKPWLNLFQYKSNTYNNHVCIYFWSKKVLVAQLVEHRAENSGVVGSSPI